VRCRHQGFTAAHQCTCSRVFFDHDHTFLFCRSPLPGMTTTVTLAGVRRELYLCDDGKDPNKRAWLETNYGEGSDNATKGKVHYVSGRCAGLCSQQSVVIKQLLL
jgi:hypothetical protein